MDADPGVPGEPNLQSCLHRAAPGASSGPGFDAIVLAGGAGRRLAGAVKPEVRVGGVALVDRALGAVAGAGRVVLVAPPELARAGVLRTLEDPPLGGPVAGIRAGLTALAAPAPPTPPAPTPAAPTPPVPAPPAPATPAVPAAAERFTEPVVERHAAPGAASRATTASLNARGAGEVVVVLACDVPRAGTVVAALVAAASAPGADGARLVDGDGRAQHLVAAYRRTALEAALVRLGDARGASVRALVADLALADVPDPGGAADDADTWDDVRRLDAELTQGREGRDLRSRGTIGPDDPHDLPTDRRTP